MHYVLKTISTIGIILAVLAFFYLVYGVLHFAWGIASSGYKMASVGARSGELDTSLFGIPYVEPYKGK